MSATGFVLGTAVYIFGVNKYHPVVKNAILIGFLGYFFAVTFLLIDLGRPWRLPYPMFVSFGTASVLFLVAWHVALYLSCQLLEFSPSIFEWAGFKTLRKWASSLILPLTIFGVILSTLHQSALGAMLLLAPGKLHPLWYTPYLPVLFFISADRRRPLHGDSGQLSHLPLPQRSSRFRISGKPRPDHARSRHGRLLRAFHLLCREGDCSRPRRSLGSAQYTFGTLVLGGSSSSSFSCLVSSL